MRSDDGNVTGFFHLLKHRAHLTNLIHCESYVTE